MASRDSRRSPPLRRLPAGRWCLRSTILLLRASACARPLAPRILRYVQNKNKNCNHKCVYFKALSLRTRTHGARALLPATRCQSSGPLGALLSSPALAGCAVDDCTPSAPNRCNNVCRTVLPPSLGCKGLSLFPSCPFSFFLPSPLSLIYPAQLIPDRIGCTFIKSSCCFRQPYGNARRIQLKTTLSHSRQARARKNFTTKLPRTTLKKENLNKKERTKTDIPREGGEDGTLPPHRDFKERSVVLAVAHPRALGALGVQLSASHPGPGS